MKQLTKREFANGVVYLLQTDDKFLIETTDTFLPIETKDAIGRKQNTLLSCRVGDRSDRWMVGCSVQSGCPIKCKFCSTAKLKKWRNLTWQEIVQQVKFVIDENFPFFEPDCSKEFKINYTRMGSPFLNIDNVKKAVEHIDSLYPTKVHHYISTIGIKGSDFSWIKDNITLQLSLHSLDEDRRRNLIPFPKLMSIKELGQIRTKSNLKTTLNLTLVDEKDFDINKLKECFDPEFFFVKLSPININSVSEKNNLGGGIIKARNLI